MSLTPEPETAIKPPKTVEEAQRVARILISESGKREDLPTVQRIIKNAKRVVDFLRNQ